MKYLKLFENYNGITIEENYGECKASRGNSYIQYFYMKDTHSLVEFNGMDLYDIYSIIGQECIYIDKLYIDPTDNPLLIRSFMKIVEDFANEMEVSTIVLIAEPFLDKRLDSNQLVELYRKFGFIIYEKLPNTEYYMMYKDL